MSIKHWLPVGGILAFMAYGEMAAQATTHHTVATVTTGESGEEEAFIRKFPDALIYAGFAHLVSGENLEAARLWERFLELAPADADTASVVRIIEEAYGRAYPDWLVYRGLSLFASGDYENAERVWARYLEIAPDEAAREAVRNLIAKARERQRIAEH